MSEIVTGTAIDCLAVVLPGKVADAVGTSESVLMRDWRENGSNPGSTLPPEIGAYDNPDEEVWLAPATRRLLHSVKDGFVDVEWCRDRYGCWYVDVPHEDL